MLSGFAYATENLTRLNLPGGLEGRTPDLYGSAYGLRLVEQAWVRSRLGKFQHGIGLGSIEATCLDVLRDVHVFRD